MINLKTSIDVISGVYKACISLESITPESGKVLRATGGLEVELGGLIEGAASRPDETPTVVTFTPNGGDTPTIVAQALAVVDAVTGVLLSLTVTNPGAGYAVAPTVAITGQGVNATATAAVASGAVTGLTIVTAGSGYRNVPTPVSFTEESRIRKVTQDLPFRFEMSTDDDALADVKVKVWLDTILARIQTEYTAHVDATIRFVETRTVQIV